MSMTRALLAGIALLVLIQFVPVDRTNPPSTAPFDGPAEVRTILERACYNCHSNQTEWPWYSRVAPVSWLVAHDVYDGREHLNFSEWASLSPDERSEHREEIWEEVDEGGMPLWTYLLLHSEARLSDAERTTLQLWSLEDRSEEQVSGLH